MAKNKKSNQLILGNLFGSMSLAFPSAQVVQFLEYGDYGTCEGSERGDCEAFYLVETLNPDNPLLGWPQKYAEENTKKELHI